MGKMNTSFQILRQWAPWTGAGGYGPTTTPGIGSASGCLDGKSFGFNIGYGFGDTSAATENMLFYEGKAHKSEHVPFNIPHREGKFDYLAPWTFTSSDGRFELEFVPILDRKDYTSLGVIASDQHQVFGLFSGGWF